MLVVFDMPTVEIQGGPEAGFYFCPHDYRWDALLPRPRHMVAVADEFCRARLWHALTTVLMMCVM